MNTNNVTYVTDLDKINELIKNDNNQDNITIKIQPENKPHNINNDGDVKQDPTFEIVAELISNNPDENIKSERYLVLVLHTYNNDNQITSLVINVFETDAKQFLHKTTYINPGSKEYFNVKNYLTVNSGLKFQSRASNTINNNTGFSVINDYKFNVYKNYEVIVNVNPNKQCVFFYEYDNDNRLHEWYYTKGSVYSYGNGIGSTKQISKYEGNKETPFEEIKNIILKESILSKPQTNTITQTDIIPNNTKPLSSATVKVLERKQQQNATKKVVTGIKGGNGNDLNLLYVNALIPTKLDTIIQTNPAKMSTWITSIVKSLYVNLTPTNNTTSANIKTYNTMYKIIDVFYTEMKTLYDVINTERDKEKQQYEDNKFYKKQKIQLYIDIYNKHSQTVKYEYTSFYMHYLDFEKFKEYLKVKYNNEKDVIKLCDTFTTGAVLDPGLIEHIQTEITKQHEHIYTYLKLTNFEQTSSSFNAPYNQRYNIYKHNKLNKIILNHLSTPNPLYIINNQNIEMVKSIPNVPQETLKLENGEIKSIKYDDSLLCGEFDGVFSPKITTEEIAKTKMSGIVSKLREGSNAFIMGYGASGSGKTSSLIYFAKKEEDGVLMHICNEMSSSHKYVEVRCVEYFKPYYIEENDDTQSIDDVLKLESGPFQFVYGTHNYQLTNEVSYKTHHTYRTGDTEHVFSKNTPMGKVVEYIIDTDRLVKATPNNPNSSRSHVLCFIRFSDTEFKSLTTRKDIQKNPVLIIGDLAGVENKFVCNNKYVLNKFYSVKRDDGSGTKFYQTEIKTYNDDGTKFDVIYGGGEEEEGEDDEESINDLNQTSVMSFEDEKTLEPILITEDNFESLFQNPYFIFNLDTVSKLYNSSELAKYIVSATKNVSIYNYVNYFLNLINLDLSTLNNDIIERPEFVKDCIKNPIWRVDKNSDNFYIFSKIICGYGAFKSLLNNLVIEYNKFNEGNSIKNKINIQTYIDNNIPKNIDLNILNPKYGGKYVAKYGLLTVIFEKIIETNFIKNQMEIIINKINECLAYNKYIKRACEHRLHEGEYINKSLQDLMEDLTYIMAYKNRDNLYYVPNFGNECFPQYCYNKSSCFNIPNVIEYNAKSDIMREIYNYLDKYKHLSGKVSENVSQSMGSDTYAQDPTIYDYLTICIFGVFNWSRISNNPPPVQYVNINSLKQLVYQRTQYNFPVNSFNTELSKIINLLNTRKTSLFALNLLNKIQKLIGNKTQVNSTIIGKIIECLKQIDNQNTISAVGTVEFLDKISKLNTIDSTCLIKNINTSDYQEIYPKKKLNR